MIKSIFNYFFFIVCALLPFSIISCEKENENKTEFKEETEETLLLFFPYSGLESSVETNIDCFKNAIVKRNGLYKSKVVVFQTKNAKQARLYEIKYDNGKCIEIDIDPDIEVSFASASQSQITQDLQKILSKVKITAPANSYSIIAGAHGSAWFPAGMYNLNELNSRAFGTGGTKYQIDNTSLITALINENIHLNYILFDACFMANIETIYEYHQVCDYFISSPTEILAYGMPYDLMGDALLKHNYDDAIKAYHNYYSNLKTPYATISVTDCRYMNELTNVMKRINSNKNKQYDISGIQVMEGLNQTIFFDFADYVNAICADHLLLQEFNSIMNMLVPYKYHTPTFYSTFNKKYISIDSYCGLSTSEPTQHTSVTDIIKQTAWHAATH